MTQRHPRRTAPAALAAAAPLIAILALAAAATPAGAQTAMEDPGRSQVTRAELLELLAHYEAAMESGAYSSALRARARTEAALIRARLAEGDFRTGDRILLTVEGEDALSGEHVVAPGPRLVLPGIGEVELAGVLRSELEGHLTAALSRYIRNPVVRAHPSLRLSVLGEVGQPGFYVFPADVPLTDVLTMAGGPTRSAKIDEIRIERGGERIWDEEPLQEVIIEGRTLDQLGLRAGDVVVVPGTGGRREVLLGVLGALPSVYVVAQLIRFLAE